MTKTAVGSPEPDPQPPRFIYPTTSTTNTALWQQTVTTRGCEHQRAWMARRWVLGAWTITS